MWNNDFNKRGSLLAGQKSNFVSNNILMDNVSIFLIIQLQMVFLVKIKSSVFFPFPLFCSFGSKYWIPQNMGKFWNKIKMHLILIFNLKLRCPRKVNTANWNVNWNKVWANYLIEKIIWEPNWVQSYQPIPNNFESNIFS